MKTELVFILDRSGSMCGLEKDVIGGFNSMLQKQKRLEEEAYVTTILFNHEISLLHNRKPIQEVCKMGDADFQTGGSTALLDAVGSAIHKISLCGNRAVFVIMSDGYENASKEYTMANVHHLIEKYKKQDWEFIFLGAGIDAVEEAEKIGIGKTRAASIQHTKQGIHESYEAACCFIEKARIKKMSEEDEDWKKNL